jgi:hypothetical protein
MYSFAIQTLVDITDNGNLKQDFPFKTLSGDLVHDTYSLNIARNQNANFTTLIQLLQVRGNITWERPPVRSEVVLSQHKTFGTHYEGKATVWTFVWEVEQQDVYNDFEIKTPCGALVTDFDYVPILTFCKESVTFPANAFITQDAKFINTQFTYLGTQTK